MKRRRPRPPVDPTDAGAAWEAALERLSRQPLPRAVLGQRLSQLGYAASVVAATLERAQRAGYLDDRAYAESLVRRRSHTRGSALIARELRSKGIEDAEASRAMEQLDPDAEEARALAMAESSLRGRPPTSGQELRRRVGAVLGRRGFRPTTIVRVITRLSGLAPVAELDSDGIETPED